MLDPTSKDCGTLAKLKRAAINFGCKKSPSARIISSMKFGAVVGAVRTGGAAFVGGETLEPLGGGIPAALAGGFMGGTIGAAGGVLKGGAIAAGCSIAKVY